MCPHDKYSIHVTSRGSGVRDLQTNAQWQVGLPELPRGPCIVTVRDGCVSYPTVAVDADGLPTPNPEVIRLLSVHSNLLPRGYTTEGLRRPQTLLFSSDLSTVVPQETYPASVDLPSRTLPALGTPSYRLEQLPLTLDFSRQWHNDDVSFTSTVITDAQDTSVPFVSFILDIEFM
jgi:hypothetical protein